MTSWSPWARARSRSSVTAASNTSFHVVSGGIDPHRFHPAAATLPEFDLIVTCRLVPVKRIDLFLRAVHCLVSDLPNVRAVIVGEGPLREALEGQARELGIEKNVTFVGQQAAVEDWLRRSRIFVLTSDSEGLSLSLMEAMMSGLPAVVSAVGDLGDLVDGWRQWLSRPRPVARGLRGTSPTPADGSGSDLSSSRRPPLAPEPRTGQNLSLTAGTRFCQNSAVRSSTVAHRVVRCRGRTCGSRRPHRLRPRSDRSSVCYRHTQSSAGASPGSFVSCKIRNGGRKRKAAPTSWRSYESSVNTLRSEPSTIERSSEQPVSIRGI